jgi:hypothetical protein
MAMEHLPRMPPHLPRRFGQPVVPPMPMDARASRQGGRASLRAGWTISLASHAPTRGRLPHTPEEPFG